MDGYYITINLIELLTYLIDYYNHIIYSNKKMLSKLDHRDFERLAHSTSFRMPQL